MLGLTDGKLGHRWVETVTADSTSEPMNARSKCNLEGKRKDLTAVIAKVLTAAI